MKKCECSGLCICKRESIIEQVEQSARDIKVNEIYPTIVEDITKSIKYLIMNHQPKIEVNEIIHKAYQQGFKDGFEFGFDKGGEY